MGTKISLLLEETAGRDGAYNAVPQLLLQAWPCFILEFGPFCYLLAQVECHGKCPELVMCAVVPCRACTTADDTPYVQECCTIGVTAIDTSFHCMNVQLLLHVATSQAIKVRIGFQLLAMEPSSGRGQAQTLIVVLFVGLVHAVAPCP